ncbi:pilus assembly protein TadG-related protein [Rhodopirellula sp. MGV]|uniref:pilus assembly protein TadG-related protein n=1 Tax=Rhodopirellula sp. MGV TaxID=2023130 RepID=UPI000B9601F7|nr:pilus assembly protein TadG-related protein [Rhodopirellula sp. MGV]OYP33173.1 hypothetical protein CGZ80_18300 [Rhodopirellula sp. MGV]PNY35095.1 hypothetical protein C2E31_19510 [Rhodopirellula baltica]
MKLKQKRPGKIAAMVVICLPVLVAMAAIVMDGGLGMGEHLNLQHAADSASTAAAASLHAGNDPGVARDTAYDMVANGQGMDDANVIVNIPPQSGQYAGQDGYVEVLADEEYNSIFSGAIDGVFSRTIKVSSVSGIVPNPNGGVISVLDPDPAHISFDSVQNLIANLDQTALVDAAISQLDTTGIAIGPLSIPGTLATVLGLVQDTLGDTVSDLLDTELLDTVSAICPPLLTLAGGMEVEGLGRLNVNGAVHVNHEGGRFDEKGKAAGSGPLPPYGLSCMPLLSTTRLAAKYMHVVGGVDNPANYLPYNTADKDPLRCNQRPVDDPLASLPIPSAGAATSNGDRVTVALTAAGALTTVNAVLDSLSPLLKTLLTPLTGPIIDRLNRVTLEPGVYDSLTIVSLGGSVELKPGVYIINDVSPITQMSLCIIGSVKAEGVLFYIAKPSSYLPLPGTIQPSVLIAPLIHTCTFEGLQDGSSPYNDVLLFQDRTDARPMIIESQNLIGAGAFAGTIYNKAGHVSWVAGGGTYDVKIVSGTLRVVTVTNTTVSPDVPFPPATTVMLLE